jgi:hypothetical protein
VASEFGEDARRSEVEKTTGTVDSCPQSWQLLRRATESEGKSRRCGGKREPRGARQGGGGLRRVNPLRLPGKGESTTGVLGVESSSPAVRIFTGRNLSDGHGARITATGNQRRRATGDEQKGGEIVIFFSLEFTVPWRIQPDELTEQV